MKSSNLDISFDKFIQEQKMELIDKIYVVGDKQKTYENLVITLNELGKKLYRNG